MPDRNYAALDSDRTALRELLRRLARRVEALERRAGIRTGRATTGTTVSAGSIAPYVLGIDAAGALVVTNTDTGTVTVVGRP